MRERHIPLPPRHGAVYGKVLRLVGDRRIVLAGGPKPNSRFIKAVDLNGAQGREAYQPAGLPTVMAHAEELLYRPSCPKRIERVIAGEERIGEVRELLHRWISDVAMAQACLRPLGFADGEGGSKSRLLTL